MLEQLNSAGIKIYIRRSARARRISIQVNRSGEVRLTIPPHGSESDAVRFLESKSQWVIEAVGRQIARPQSPELTIDQLNEYIRAANSYLPERIKYISQNLGLEYNNLSITKAKTRWGSCSTRNDISLSFHLMRLPKHLIDFVIIHELCHTIHHNHSDQFHALVNRFTGGKESSLNSELRGYKI